MATSVGAEFQHVERDVAARSCSQGDASKYSQQMKKALDDRRFSRRYPWPSLGSMVTAIERIVEVRTRDASRGAGMHELDLARGAETYQPLSPLLNGREKGSLSASRPQQPSSGSRRTANQVEHALPRHCYSLVRDRPLAASLTTDFRSRSRRERARCPC